MSYLRQSHLFVGIYGRRYGGVGPGMTISGLEDEYLLSAGKPRLLYIKADVPDRLDGSRWPSSSPRRACSCCRPSSSRRASTTASRCSRAGPATCRTASARCSPRSTGASTC